MIFDRQLLYLVFVFGVQRSTGAAVYPRLESAEISSQSLSSSLSSSASSAGLAAVSHATKIYPSQDATSTSSSTTRRSTKSTGQDSSTYPPTAVQSASSIASSSIGPNNPASTSTLSVNKSRSTTVGNRSASYRSPSSHDSSATRSTTTTTTTTTRRPGSSITTLPHTRRPVNSTVQSSQHINAITGSSRVVTVLANGTTLFASATGTHNHVANITTSTSTTATSDPLGGLISALGHIASLSASDSPSTMSPSPTTTNALSVLFSALPSSVADPIESDFNSLTSELLASSTQTPHRPPHHSTHHMSYHTKMTSSTSSTSSTYTTPTTTATPTLSSHTSMPTVNPQSTNTVAAASSSSSAPAIGTHPISNASVAGIASGISAGAVLVLLGGVYLLRRRKQGKAPFGPRGSQRSKGSGRRIFPEVAWLYDPVITPPRSPSHGRTPSGSGQSLIPDPRPGSIEMEAGSASLSLRPARPSSPLLAPSFPGSREQSPGGSPEGSSGGSSRRSRGASTDNLRRPLTAIFEEPQAR